MPGTGVTTDEDMASVDDDAREEDEASSDDEVNEEDDTGNEDDETSTLDEVDSSSVGAFSQATKNRVGIKDKTIRSILFVFILKFPFVLEKIQ